MDRHFHFVIIIRLRDIPADGSELATQAFMLGTGDRPVSAIDTLQTETDTGEQRWFVNLLVALVGQ